MADMTEPVSSAGATPESEGLLMGMVFAVSGSVESIVTLSVDIIVVCCVTTDLPETPVGRKRY
jgi:hypothetical protein